MKAKTLKQVIEAKLTDLEAKKVDWVARGWSPKVLDEGAEELRIVLIRAEGAEDPDAFMVEKLRDLRPHVVHKPLRKWIGVVAEIWSL